jgi:outer membrane immunogenic protein
LDPYDTVTSSVSPKGFLLGGYTGLNYQVGSIVFGFEGDFIGSWGKTTITDTAGDTETVNVFWTSTATARLGWAFDRLLIFAKGGAAFLYHRENIGGPGPNALPAICPAIGCVASGSSVLASWTVGGGLEWAVTDHWIARGEYSYMKFPIKAEFVTAPPNTAQVGMNFNELKAGIGYKF